MNTFRNEGIFTNKYIDIDASSVLIPFIMRVSSPFVNPYYDKIMVLIPFVLRVSSPYAKKYLELVSVLIPFVMRVSSPTGSDLQIERLGVNTFRIEGIFTEHLRQANRGAGVNTFRNEGIFTQRGHLHHLWLVLIPFVMRVSSPGFS